ncbi:unnamed protein product [Owenia fusiformis]|uniref:Uncharacterized protein n=1 Tax=Owenia fusiformis TaxID=6347 RepID=A0A8S4PNU1_OWEFU|nr:unnamed protein product [Owenia fusiformis]
MPRGRGYYPSRRDRGWNRDDRRKRSNWPSEERGGRSRDRSRGRSRDRSQERSSKWARWDMDRSSSRETVGLLQSLPRQEHRSHPPRSEKDRTPTQPLDNPQPHRSHPPKPEKELKDSTPKQPQENPHPSAGVDPFPRYPPSPKKTLKNMGKPSGHTPSATQTTADDHKASVGKHSPSPQTLGARGRSPSLGQVLSDLHALSTDQASQDIPIQFSGSIRSLMDELSQQMLSGKKDASDSLAGEANSDAIVIPNDLSLDPEEEPLWGVDLRKSKSSTWGKGSEYKSKEFVSSTPTSSTDDYSDTEVTVSARKKNPTTTKSGSALKDSMDKGAKDKDPKRDTSEKSIQPPSDNKKAPAGVSARHKPDIRKGSSGKTPLPPKSDVKKRPTENAPPPSKSDVKQGPIEKVPQPPRSDAKKRSSENAAPPPKTDVKQGPIEKVPLLPKPDVKKLLSTKAMAPPKLDDKQGAIERAMVTPPKSSEQDATVKGGQTKESKDKVGEVRVQSQDPTLILRRVEEVLAPIKVEVRFRYYARDGQVLEDHTLITRYSQLKI